MASYCRGNAWQSSIKPASRLHHPFCFSWALLASWTFRLCPRNATDTRLQCSFIISSFLLFRPVDPDTRLTRVHSFGHSSEASSTEPEVTSAL